MTEGTRRKAAKLHAENLRAEWAASLAECDHDDVVAEIRDAILDGVAALRAVEAIEVTIEVPEPKVPEPTRKGT